jgi:hypothetical protein
MIKWHDPDIDLGIGLQIEIQASKIHVIAQVDRVDEPSITSTLRVALDASRTAVELVAFKQGWGLSASLSQYVDPDGIRRQILPRSETLSELCTAFDLSKDFDWIFTTVLEDPSIWPILNDLISAINSFHVAPLNCARAVEGVRHSVAGGKCKNRTKEWELMRTILNISESYISLITDNSIDHRHGKRTVIHGSVSTEIARRAWIIMNRFLEYRKRGSLPLPAADFPTLTD